MRVFIPLFFLTLVLSGPLTWAAPQTTTTLPTAPMSAEEDPLLAHIVPGQRPRTSFLLNASLGFAGGNYLERDEYEQGPFVALRYMPLTEELPKWDYQLEVNREKLVGIAVGHRWYCCPGDSFLPYARLSANAFFESSGELAGIVEIRRWRLRGSLGVGENFISEFGVGYAITGPDLFAQFGYNFAF